MRANESNERPRRVGRRFGRWRLRPSNWFSGATVGDDFRNDLGGWHPQNQTYYRWRALVRLFGDLVLALVLVAFVTLAALEVFAWWVVAVALVVIGGTLTWWH